MISKNSAIIIILFCIVSCSTSQVATPNMPPIATIADFTPTLISTTEYAPTYTPSVTPVPTIMPSPTINWSATPTPISGTESIIEVTPIGGNQTQIYWVKDEDIDADYLVYNTLNVRPCVWIDTCPSLRKIGGGSIVHVILMRTIYPAGDVWLMLDENPVAWIAFSIVGQGTFGELEIVNE